MTSLLALRLRRAAQRPTARLAFLAACLLVAAPVRAELSRQDLAKIAQNPVGNLVSVPFQNNTNFGFGSQGGTQNILNIQPVIPVSVNKDWNVITRTIIPAVWLPPLYAGDDRTSGVGDVQFSAFLSPAEPGTLIWGAGAIAQLPTHSNAELGNRNWGLGPTFVVLHLEHGDPWVYGVLANNVWSVGDRGSPSYNNGLVQPFLNYNLPGGTYLTSSPVVTADWKATSSERWTVPLGGGVGHIFHFGRLPVNAQLGAYYNVIKPDNAANWQLRVQVQFMFPK